MGGCCCCYSRRAHLNGTPVYYYCPQALEEHESVSSHHGVASTLSTGLLVDTNLETSIPDTYRAPPAPIPYDVDLGRPRNSPSLQGTGGNKNDTTLQIADSDFVVDTTSGSSYETSATCEDLKESDCETEVVLDSPKKSELEQSKSTEPIASTTEEEDVCPTCFEEYDVENPRIITKCEHHFHLSCILEWMERSDTCPVCDQEMIFNHSFNI